MHKLETTKLNQKAYVCNGLELVFDVPQIMAIINLTPDSFYDGGKYGELADVLRDIAAKIEAGANIIDIGAASSRSGATLLSPELEITRLSPVLKAVRREFSNTLLSVDTFHSDVARMAASEGANLLNDISGGVMDEAMLETVAELNLPYILMHMQGTPATMAQLPALPTPVESVTDFFKQQISRLNALHFDQIILDPGFGFGKSLENNYTLLSALQVFKSLGYPVLVGVSRKSMINKITLGSPVTALNGTTVLHTVALLNGANILRVHDVTEAKEAIKLVSFYRECVYVK